MHFIAEHPHLLLVGRGPDGLPHDPHGGGKIRYDVLDVVDRVRLAPVFGLGRLQAFRYSDQLESEAHVLTTERLHLGLHPMDGVERLGIEVDSQRVQLLL